MKSVLIGSLLAAATVHAEGPVEVEFIPALYSHRFSAESYQAIWDTYGTQIIESLELRTCLTFSETEVGAVVDDDVSHSGSPDDPMLLRATYTDSTKMTTLVHEIGHRHLWQLEERLGWVDSHQTLYLVLDEVWADVWGKEFAIEAVRNESRWRSEYDYADAWTWAYSLSRLERARLWNQILDLNGFEGTCYGLLEPQMQGGIRQTQASEETSQQPSNETDSG